MQTSSPLWRPVARVLSYLLHPLFVPALIFAGLMLLCPQALLGVPAKTQTWWLITISYITITFPLLTVFLLWRLKFIDSFQMHDLKERYGPLIASMLFYFWVFWLFHKQFQAPVAVQTWLGAIFFSTVLAFMASIFFKVSLHTAAWGAVVSFFLLFALLGLGGLAIPLLISLLLAGAVGSARLYLGAHTPRQVWWGYALGALATCISYFLIKHI